MGSISQEINIAFWKVDSIYFILKWWVKSTISQAYEPFLPHLAFASLCSNSKSCGIAVVVGWPGVAFVWLAPLVGQPGHIQANSPVCLLYHP